MRIYLTSWSIAPLVLEAHVIWMNHDINMWTCRREPRVPTLLKWMVLQVVLTKGMQRIVPRSLFQRCGVLPREGGIWGISLVIVTKFGFWSIKIPWIFHVALDMNLWCLFFLVCLVPNGGFWVLIPDFWLLGRIIPVSKWLGSPPFRSHGVRPSERVGTSPVRGLTITMVLNHWT